MRLDGGETLRSSAAPETIQLVPSAGHDDILARGVGGFSEGLRESV
jgi:hypothetical protein